ncbi:MAG: hypothetical protein ACPGWR_01960 [Ardenticatenaceae bacterium]
MPSLLFFPPKSELCLIAIGSSIRRLSPPKLARPPISTDIATLTVLAPIMGINQHIIQISQHPDEPISHTMMVSNSGNTPLELILNEGQPDLRRDRFKFVPS